MNDQDPDIDDDGVNNADDPFPYFSINSTTILFEGLPAGEYSITIVDDNATNANCNDIIIENIELISPVDEPMWYSEDYPLIENVSCYVDEDQDGVNDVADGSFIVEYSGGLPNAWNWGFILFMIQMKILIRLILF